MERKIGEIFEYNGEWYQCAEDTDYISCINCCFYNGGHKLCTDKDIGACIKEYRSDAKPICFKKLEKVGESFYRRWTLEGNNKLMQRYKIYTTPLITIDKQKLFYNLTDDLLEIEIKQNMEENKLNLKPFDIQKAKKGKPVCTRDGRKARIICFDRLDAKPILALIKSTDGKVEDVFDYSIEGKRIFNSLESDLDLMMLPEKKEGWVNVYRDCDGVNITKDDNIYSSKDAAIASAQIIDRDNYVATTIIKWEE